MKKPSTDRRPRRRGASVSSTAPPGPESPRSGRGRRELRQFGSASDLTRSRRRPSKIPVVRSSSGTICLPDAGAPPTPGRTRAKSESVSVRAAESSDDEVTAAKTHRQVPQRLLDTCRRCSGSISSSQRVVARQDAVMFLDVQELARENVVADRTRSRQQERLDAHRTPGRPQRRGDGRQRFRGNVLKQARRC